MIEVFLDTIRNVGIFIICAQAIIHFRPKASYEKYLKVLVSIIVLVMLIVPCFKVLGDVEIFMDNMEQYEDFFGEQIIGMEEMKVPTAEEEDKVNSRLNNPIETVVIKPVEVKE